MLKDIFTGIYDNNTWSSSETRSGGGSEIGRTKQIREQLPAILKRLGTKTLLDAGCGDWNWMSTIPLPDIRIAACDIVQSMITANTYRFGRFFFTADITKDPLPQVDVVLCRTVLFHLSYANAFLALENFKRSQSKYLLITHHPNQTDNVDIRDGNWRRLNLCLAPFHLPPPIEAMEDGDGQDGYLGLWDLTHL